MEVETVVCNARIPGGGVCGATATVLAVQRFYDTFMYKPGAGGRFDVQLRETHYEIDCPHCGRRTQIVKADAN